MTDKQLFSDSQNQLSFVGKEAFLCSFNRGGCVLDFGTDGFDSFTQNSVGIALIKRCGVSKGESLELFAQNAREEDAFKLFSDLMHYFKSFFRNGS
ncbi:hypothetical protein [Bifidobacterium sp.]|uniref:hypothetical protein n=1 Tax=Bifidobacterium sp. TaxID=41200 RepID=UPI0025C4B693|nr:hypothetical protein [Bifidobacterium sp.]MCI1636108.1 hypothetical protein [Bifidobacterium sp.]